jgi:hypothetical protein
MPHCHKPYGNGSLSFNLNYTRSVATSLHTRPPKLPYLQLVSETEQLLRSDRRTKNTYVLTITTMSFADWDESQYRGKEDMDLLIQHQNGGLNMNPWGDDEDSSEDDLGASTTQNNPRKQGEREDEVGQSEEESGESGSAEGDKPSPVDLVRVDSADEDEEEGMDDVNIGSGVSDDEDESEDEDNDDDDEGMEDVDTVPEVIVIEDEEDGNIEENDDTDASVDEDIFEGFNVIDKEFMREMLRLAPKEEIEALKTAREELQAMNQPQEPAAPKGTNSSVQGFARSHPFFTRKVAFDEEDIEDYKRDVYNFSRKAGLGRNQSKVEVMMAVAMWKKATGFGTGILLEDFDSDSENNAMTPSSIAPHLRSAQEYYKDSDAVLIVQDRVVNAARHKKRKRDSSAHKTVLPTPEDMQAAEKRAAKRRKRLEKKKARKMARMARKAQEQAGLLPERSAGDVEQTSNVTANSEIQTASSQLKKPSVPRKKKAKPGPTTSAYFTTNQSPSLKQSGPGTTSSMSSHLPQALGLGKRTNGQMDLDAPDLTRSERSESSPADSPSASKISGGIEKAMMEVNLVEELDETHDAAVEEGLKALGVGLGGPQSFKGEASTAKKTRKRKRKRNKNALAPEIVEVQSHEVPLRDESNTAYLARIHKEQDLKRRAEKLILSHDFAQTDQSRPPSRGDDLGDGDLFDFDDSVEEFATFPTARKIDETWVTEKGNTPSKERDNKNKMPVNGVSKAITEVSEQPTQLVSLPAAPAEPLSELSNTNSNDKTPRSGRRDRGRKKASLTKSSPSVEFLRLNEQEQRLKARHS